MLTLIEQFLFAIATFVSLYFTYRGFARIMNHINGGQGKIDWSLVTKRIGELILKVGLFQPVFRFRFWPSLMHGLIGWGFLSFLLINLADLIYAYTDWKLLDHAGLFGDLYRLLADVANVAILLGILYMGGVANGFKNVYLAGVLHRIAVAYFFAALIFAQRNFWAAAILARPAALMPPMIAAQNPLRPSMMPTS